MEFAKLAKRWAFGRWLCREVAKACDLGDVAALESLLSRGADPDRPWRGITPLHGSEFFPNGGPFQTHVESMHATPKRPRRRIEDAMGQSPRRDARSMKNPA
jgi:hypothetical protein